MRQSMIELALPVISAADESFDFSIPRVEGYERHLRLRDGFVASLLRKLTLPFVVSLLQQRVHVLHAGFDGRDGVAFQRGIQSRVHAEILAQ